MGDETLDKVEEVAGVLDKDTVHFVAAAEHIDGTSLQKLYFSQPTDDGALDRLEAAARLCGVDEATWAPMGSRREALAGKTTFLSVGFSDGQLLPGTKIDVHDLPPDVVASVMADAGRDGAAVERMDLLLKMIDKPTVDYAGFKLRPGRPVATRVYGYRSSR